MRSLIRLINHEVMGQKGRFERFMASMAYVMACGEKLDKDRSESFGDQMDSVYRNPFKTTKLQTRKEIEDYIVKRLTQ